MVMRLKWALVGFGKRVRMDYYFIVDKVGMVKQGYAAVITNKEY
jgi:hypothetical protein